MAIATSPEILSVLAEVGGRLKQVRTQRGVTLTELAAATAISKSTLSRLEAGQRKPSLELLLPIAQAHGAALDDLVDPAGTETAAASITRGLRIAVRAQR